MRNEDYGESKMASKHDHEERLELYLKVHMGIRTKTTLKKINPGFKLHVGHLLEVFWSKPHMILKLVRDNNNHQNWVDYKILTVDNILTSYPMSRLSFTCKILKHHHTSICLLVHTRPFAMKIFGC